MSFHCAVSPLHFFVLLCTLHIITLFYCFGAACNSSDTRASRARSNSGARECYIFGKVSCTNAHVTSCLRSGNFKELVLAASQVIVTGVQVCRVNAGGLCKRRSDPHGFGCLKGATASTVAGKACSKACSKAALTCCTNALSQQLPCLMLLQVPITAGAPIPAAEPVEPESLSKEARAPTSFITSGSCQN